MQGIDIIKSYYLKYGKPMIEKDFADYENRIAVGIVGEGSECLGYDDEQSKDHDFDPSFCMFIPKSLEEKIGFKLERAFAALPKEFMGLKKSAVSPVGGGRRGVITIEDFYTRFLGEPNAPDCVEKWLYTPSYALLNASNGEIFRDDLGEFSKIRAEIKKGYPLDVRKKKIAACLALMAQSGQYNYMRCINRGEYGAAQLAVFEFVKKGLSLVYLLNNAYEPFYKWVYKGLKNLNCLSETGEVFSGLTELGNSKKEAAEKYEIIEDVAAIIIEELIKQGLTKATCNNLETHAYSVQDGIKDIYLRNMHVMQGI